MPSARLVPELLVGDIARSLAFYVDLIGFVVAYDRPEEGFAYLDLEGAELMLEETAADDPGAWWTGPPEPPLGRGVNLQIEVADIDALAARLEAARQPLFRPLQDRWYRAGALEVGNRQLLVQDPDGYLLRFFGDLGERPIAAVTPR